MRRCWRGFYCHPAFRYDIHRKTQHLDYFRRSILFPSPRLQETMELLKDLPYGTACLLVEGRPLVIVARNVHKLWVLPDQPINVWRAFKAMYIALVAYQNTPSKRLGPQAPRLQAERDEGKTGWLGDSASSNGQARTSVLNMGDPTSCRRRCPYKMLWNATSMLLWRTVFENKTGGEWSRFLDWSFLQIFD